MVSKSDILEALGMESNDRFLMGMFLGIGVGALVGGAVALLLAPRSGQELRDMLGEKKGELFGRAKQKKDDVMSELRKD